MINHFGLDIGSDSIKIVQVANEGNTFRLITAGMIKTPGNGISDAERDLVAVAEAIKKLKTEIKVGTNRVVTSLPERSVFSQIIELPKMSEEELRQAIPWEAENLIPQPLSEVSLDWEVIPDEISAKLNKVKVLLVAAPTALVNKYLQVLKLADLEAVALETEIITTLRVLKLVFSQGDFVLLNLGSKTVDIILINRGNLFSGRQLPMAGEAITRALTSALGFDFATAEEYKKSYGYSGQAENKVAAAIEPILTVVTEEVKKAIHFYTEKLNESPKLAVLTGGTSLLPGIAEYFTKTLGIEVQIVDPFTLIKVDESNKALLKKIAPVFTVALGSAMREG
ncbi:hypothetical protein COS54_03095 [Candidatus Shapirobacteria bacterium CG03_land_8_20_14_0_80_39_12]|uniref:SHS2 domain-containing protein n=1 Tax=Candidatus Shapirobacteria bacterium CG03_land_8_20_14_0_80_39_12 TaxID=1974879 RepID=A0A2M7BBI6_9BACT|nr:MAG: hypothetical protein COS54_03095 [Candidatus Shapirobacteria bacterium CG03_land_8_20_14_0_80_39_12]